MSKSYKEFAGVLGYQSDAIIRAWEAREITPIPDTLLHIAACCSVSGSWLITGKRGVVAQPTPAIRFRAVRHLKGLSRLQMGLKTDPSNFTQVGQALATVETRNQKVDKSIVRKLAAAFDVPEEFLDPASPAATVSSAQLTTLGVEHRLPTATRVLIEQIRMLSILNKLDGQAIAALQHQVTLHSCEDLKAA